MGTSHNIMKWKAFINDRLFDSDDYDWINLPKKGFLCVMIIEVGAIHKLVGADYYWVKDDCYGMVYDGSCCKIGYSWWKGGEKMNEEPPNDIVLKEGLMLSDNEWKQFMEKLHGFR